MSDGGLAVRKTMVVYYSATGNTEAMVNYIMETVGGDSLNCSQ